MKPTKRYRGQDQLGRSGSAFPIRLLPLTLFAVIVGSAWPTAARSLDPAYDSGRRAGCQPSNTSRSVDANLGYCGRIAIPLSRLRPQPCQDTPRQPFAGIPRELSCQLRKARGHRLRSRFRPSPVNSIAASSRTEAVRSPDCPSPASASTAERRQSPSSQHDGR